MTGDLSLFLRWSVLVVGALVLQVGVLADVRVLGVHPDAMLLVAVAAGVAAGASRGAQVGFAAGLLADLVMPGVVGVAALSDALAGFAVGAVAETLLSTSRSVRVGLCAAASAAGVLTYGVVSALLGRGWPADPTLWAIVGIVAAFNAVGSLPALAACRWAERGSRDR